MTMEWRWLPNWNATFDKATGPKTITLQMQKETRQPLGFAPSNHQPVIEVPAVYRQREAE